MKSNDVNMNDRNVLFFTLWQTLFRIVFIQEVVYQLYKYVHWVNSELDLSVMKVFWKATALPLWMVMEIHWKRYCVFNGWDMTIVNLLLISCISSIACAFHDSPAWIATEKNKCVPLNFSYFAVLLTATLSAATPAVREVCWEMERCKSIRHCNVPR